MHTTWQWISILVTISLRTCCASSSSTSSDDPFTSINACTAPLTPSDVANSFGNPCPQYFDPLPSQGALSNSMLTIFGFPALVDFSGSIVTTDATSMTYALTCLDSDIPDLVGAQCLSSGVVVPFTASGWNWHVTTTQTDEATWVSALSMSATINPGGTISYELQAVVTPAVDKSTYSTTHTWTGHVEIVDPSIVPVAGLEKIGGAGTSSDQSTATSGASTSGETTASSAAAGKTGLAARSYSPSDRVWILLGAPVLLTAALAFVL